MSGHRIGLVTPLVDVSYVAPDDDGWSMEELAGRIPDLVESGRSLLRV
jgi:hypothetical protein